MTYTGATLLLFPLAKLPTNGGGLFPTPWSMGTPVSPLSPVSLHSFIHNPYVEAGNISETVNDEKAAKKFLGKVLFTLLVDRDGRTPAVAPVLNYTDHVSGNRYVVLFNLRKDYQMTSYFSSASSFALPSSPITIGLSRVMGVYKHPQPSARRSLSTSSPIRRRRMGRSLSGLTK